MVLHSVNLDLLAVLCALCVGLVSSRDFTSDKCDDFDLKFGEFPEGLGFGSNKQYKCHCENMCNADGTCNSNGKCQSGWFGLKCQYQDLVTLDDTTTSPTINKLVDRDDRTCMEVRDDVVVNFNKHFVFTWLRLVVSNESSLSRFTVHFTKDGDPAKIECKQRRLHLVAPLTLDIRCYLMEEISKVIISSRGVKSLCSLYINGGRNVALKQETWQTSVFVEDGVYYNSSLAVDGYLDPHFYRHQCTHTMDNEQMPMWTVHFKPSNITRYVLYNRCYLEPRLIGFTLEATGAALDVFHHKDNSDTRIMVYTVLDSENRVITDVRINVTEGDKILTLCEVEIYGECSSGTWGLDCQKCPAECSDTCHIDDGSCNVVCSGYSNPPLCNQECDEGFFGINCMQKCPANCIECDSVFGQCLHCKLGFYGEDCKPCPNSWFGSRCQYLCHCEGNCNNEGECTEYSRCASGWFGPQCQYRDLVRALDAAIVSDPPLHSDWLLDNDDFTCNTNPEFHSIIVRWNQSYPFTWLRIVTLEPAIILNMTVSFKTEVTMNNMELHCEDQKLVVTHGNTIDVYCSLNTTIKQVILRNVKSLCTLYISGGFNAALKQTASQSSIFTEDGAPYESFQAMNAVDGNTNSSLQNHSCTHTRPGDPEPTWSLVFDVPIIAKTFLLYNRYETPPSLNRTGRLHHFMLLTHDVKNNTVFNYRDTTPGDHIIYQVADPMSIPISSVQIKVDTVAVTDLYPILTLCEVETFAECLPGTWGLGCNKTCPISCKDFCHVDSGSCNTVCAGQNDPPLCLSDCDYHKWGLNCDSVCSSHCLHQVCDKHSGECTDGCLGYNNPQYCTQACPAGYWGVNCTDYCSSHCDLGVCNGQTKACTHGCMAGYMLPNCTEGCPIGFYGRNCSFVCSSNCVDGKCDPVSGDCVACVSGYQAPSCVQECSAGFWGLSCSQHCSSHCVQLKCHGQTSECTYGCSEGFAPPNCTHACHVNFYGRNCSYTCSQNCIDSKCDPVTGHCYRCIPGYTGDFCELDCNATYFGQDCLHKCNSSCLHQLCHPTNGTCLQCPMGKGGDDCHDCPLGTYGENCLLVCKHCQLGTKCDPVTGNCISF